MLTLLSTVLALAGPPAPTTLPQPTREAVDGDGVSGVRDPEEIVRGARFGVRIDHDVTAGGILSVELVEAGSGRVARQIRAPQTDDGAQEVELLYAGDTASLWLVRRRS